MLYIRINININNMYIQRITTNNQMTKKFYNSNDNSTVPNENDKT